MHGSTLDLVAELQVPSIRVLRGVSERNNSTRRREDPTHLLEGRQR